jgi:hypothetical protein
VSSRLTDLRLFETIGFSGKVNMIEITREMAQQLVEFVSGETGFNMIVCDTRGVIIGDSGRERFGVRHEMAARIMSGKAASIGVTKEDEVRSGGKMREGTISSLKDPSTRWWPRWSRQVRRILSTPGPPSPPA